MSAIDNSAAIELDAIRNIGIIAHIDAGKTTVAERFLYYSGKTHRIGEIDDGSTVMDYLDEERQRGITIVAAAASFPWHAAGIEALVHLIDTPGHIDFTVEVERSLRVIDGAIVIFSGVEGVEAQSEKVWRQSDYYSVPKIAFINKLDRLGASFERVINEIKNKFSGIRVAPLAIPIGIESELTGTIDLLSMEALRFTGDDGAKVQREEIPEEMIEPAKRSREELLLTLADLSDPIAELYIEEDEIPIALIQREIRRLVIQRKIVPVFTGSAKRNIGIQPLMEAVLRYLPSPRDRNHYPAVNPKNGENIDIQVDDENFSGLVFKLIASGSADLLYLRTYSGHLHLNDTLVNARTREKVRIKRLLRLYAKNIEAVEEVGPGDIIGVIGPTETFTGDTLCAVNRPVLLEKISFPEPVISVAVEPKSAKDRDRLDACLQRLCREDPTLELRRHEATGQQLLSGMGELHLEINCHRIRDEFRIEARFGVPQVAFRETLNKPVNIRGIFDRTIGDQVLYAAVEIELNPVPRLETGIEVENKIPRGKHPASWLATAEEALCNGLKTGGNWGYPLIYIRGTLKNLDGHPEKTSDSAVAGAVLNGLHEAVRQGTKLLEPLVRLDILSPENCIGEITGYIQSRRAIIHGIENMPDIKHLKCEVPLAEMFGFSKALPKLSGGRAAFSMEPCGYQEISPDQLERLANRQTKLM